MRMTHAVCSSHPEFADNFFPVRVRSGFAASELADRPEAFFDLVNVLSTLTAWFVVLSVPGLRCGATRGQNEAPSFRVRHIAYGFDAPLTISNSTRHRAARFHLR
jgi:hypothetical protein